MIDNCSPLAQQSKTVFSFLRLLQDTVNGTPLISSSPVRVFTHQFARLAPPQESAANWCVKSPISAPVFAFAASSLCFTRHTGLEPHEKSSYCLSCCFALVNLYVPTMSTKCRTPPPKVEGICPGEFLCLISSY